jgi:deazaflavin-dependent oxidoreductase (nitroreductase family)
MQSVTSQRSEPFAEPSREDIVGISRHHVEAMEASDDEAIWTFANMSHLVLTTTGRRSGRTHKVALPFWLDPSGHRVVIASFAGAEQHPAWYLNLCDRDANPSVHVRVRGASYDADAQVLTGEDRARTWTQLVEDRPHYADYQTRTSREIPVVRLVERTVS